jgi:hypothetical protein
MLNQASGDGRFLQVSSISAAPSLYVTHSGEGEGLCFMEHYLPL